MIQGPAAKLDAFDAAATLAGDSPLAAYHLFPRVRGDLVMKMAGSPMHVKKSSAIVLLSLHLIASPRRFFCQGRQA